METIPVDQRKDQGRVEIFWDKNDPKSIASAQEEYATYIKKGWIAFSTLSDGKHIQVLSFDPSLERITLIIPIEGGSLPVNYNVGIACIDLFGGSFFEVEELTFF